MLRAGNLGAIPHGFSTRGGEPAESVISGAPLILAKQVHSSDVVTVFAPWDDQAPRADALVTNQSGLLIGIVTADCAPVLLADCEARVVGAAHAGWRGALGGVLGNTIAAMEALGATRTRIAATIGPTIAQSSYEVDGALRDRFPPRAQRFFAPGQPDHWQFDLPGFVASLLREGGVGSIVDLGEDTYAQEAHFYSYRRATHRGEPTGGRQTSVIGL